MWAVDFAPTKSASSWSSNLAGFLYNGHEMIAAAVLK